MEMMLTLLTSTLRLSIPLLFAAYGGLLSERSGVVNIALEGMMLVGAASAAIFTLSTGSPWLGVIASMLCGALFASLYALCVINLRTNQIVAGTGMNMLAAGLIPFVLKLLYGVTGSTPGLPLTARFHYEPLIMGGLLIILLTYWFYFTRSGLWVQFAGEHPEALDTAGVRVNLVRWCAVVTSGALAALGGATLSIYLSSSYSANMSASRGFMSLAALILGKWKPLPTFLACLLFGFFDALQIRLQGVPLFGGREIPVQFIQILPYLMTLLVLAGLVGSSRPPKYLGTPFSKH